MAVSFSSPDPSSPAQVAGASFGVARKGFDQDEVRDFLERVAAELERTRERIDELERQLVDAREAKQVKPDQLDEATVTRLVGEETARILRTAHEGAAQIRSRAEDGAAALLREATDDANRLREDARNEAARERNAANLAAKAEVDTAKAQGREMVNEARAYRERVLTELGRRRDLARQQIERLIGERDRLLGVFVQARDLAGEVVGSLEPLALPDEEPPPAGPSSGPVPIIDASLPETATTESSGTEPETEAGTAAEAEPTVEAGGRHEGSEVLGAGEPPAAAVAVGEVAPGGTDATVPRTASDVAVAEVSDEVTSEAEPVGGDEDAGEEETAAVPDGVAMATPYDVEDEDEDDDADDADAEDESAEAADATAIGGPGVLAEPAADEDDDSETVDETIDEAVDEPGDADVDGDDDTVDRSAAVVALFPSAVDEGVEGDDQAGDDDHVTIGGPDADDGVAAAAVMDDRATDDEPDETKAAQVDDLFARLRASAGDDADGADDDARASSDETGSDGSPDTGPTRADDRSEGGEPARPDDATSALDALSLFARRDAELSPLIAGSARKLKRVLADEQNNALTALRAADPVSDVDALLQTEAEQIERYLDAVSDNLESAVQAGATSVAVSVGDVGDVADVTRSGALGPVRDAIASQLLAPLRKRVTRAIDEAEGDNEVVVQRIRAIYREWKTQHIDTQLDDIFRLAYGRGAFAALPTGTPVRWIVDPDGPECPDAEDNSLAGDVSVGEPFPTGHVCAPAHAGCRCLLSIPTS